jgi:hypothetical protein
VALPVLIGAVAYLTRLVPVVRGGGLRGMNSYDGAAGRFQSGVRSTLTGTVNSYHSLEEQSIGHGSSLVAHSTHGHDSGERCPHVFLVSIRYKREHDRDVAGLQRFARCADHRSVK